MARSHGIPANVQGTSTNTTAQHGLGTMEANTCCPIRHLQLVRDRYDTAGIRHTNGGSANFCFIAGPPSHWDHAISSRERLGGCLDGAVGMAG